MEGKIDWSSFNDRYVRLTPGVEKTLVLTNWVGGEWFGRPGINFDVVEEDGQAVSQKQFTITSNRLIRAFRPILVRAEEKGMQKVSVRILRSGEGQNTRYAISEWASRKQKREKNAQLR